VQIRAAADFGAFLYNSSRYFDNEVMSVASAMDLAIFPDDLKPTVNETPARFYSRESTGCIARNLALLAGRFSCFRRKNFPSRQALTRAARFTTRCARLPRPT
jgi:hypothetical protein